MVSHFSNWLSEAHDIDFAPVHGDFSNALKHRTDGKIVAAAEVWPLLDSFFQKEMNRQTLVPGAREALATLAEIADIVVLTNLTDEFNEARAEQLGAHGIWHRVVTNQGGKGSPVAKLVAEFAPSVTVFVDDLARHHESVARHAPDVLRLHMIAEPSIATVTPPAPFATVRIDHWDDALPWIQARFSEVPVEAA
ncbi:MAG: family hydrolase [Sphingomonadales bacterium]|nr:family hydrolase [Sphingomonadales bacterium]